MAHEVLVGVDVGTTSIKAIAVTPAGEILSLASRETPWRHSGPPTYNPGRREWELYAFDPREKPVVGHRSREWVAIAESELEVVAEMARCLAEISAGRVPR